MTTDARISVGFPAHPKTKRVIRKLRESGAWHLMKLILWTASNRPHGDLSGLTAEDIELAVDWNGEPDAFVNTLVEAGFLDGQDGCYVMHDWADHNPWVNGSDLRSAKARWNAIKRHEGIESANRKVPEWAAIRAENAASSNAGSTKKGAISTAISNAIGTKTDAPSPSPSPSPSPRARAKAPESPNGDSPPSPDGEGANGSAGKLNLTAPTDLGEKKAQRLRQVTLDAITAFNAKLGKPNGNLASVSQTVGFEKKQTQVRRCLRVATQICREQDGDPRVTPEFWKTYFAYVDRDPFKSGRTQPGEDHSNWRPTFEYLTREKTMLEVFDAAVAESAA